MLYGHAEDDPAGTALGVIVVDATHPDLLGDPLGCAVVGVDDGGRAGATTEVTRSLA